jgi:hypothetical protein
MFKIAMLAVLAGLATALPGASANAQAFVPGQTAPDPVSGSDDTECAYQLNYMPRVTRALIDAISGQPVYLIPVCENGLLDHRDYGWLFAGGNVGTLRVPIARNRTLMQALTAEGYDQHDVISLRVGGDNGIVLYVHQRDMR